MNWTLTEAFMPDNTRETMRLPAGLVPRTGELVTLENRLLPSGEKELFIVQTLLWQTGNQDTERFALAIVLQRAQTPPDLRLAHLA